MYKGYSLFHCWCGYPEKRWLILLGNTWQHTAKTLKEAKNWINGMLNQNHQ